MATNPDRALRRAGAGRAAGGCRSAERAAPSGGRRGERPGARARALTGRGAASAQGRAWRRLPEGRGSPCGSQHRFM